MILVFEMCWTGPIHAPGNSATLQIVARAWPEQEVRFHADPTHLEELRHDPALMALPNLRLVPIEVSPLWRWRPHAVSGRRLRQEYRTVRAALRQVPPGEPCLVFLISTTATGSFAAAWAARLSGRRAAVQVGFHGNLNDALGWRPRNPLARALDTRAALQARYPVPLRFLVLEEGIRAALEKAIPRAAARTDVLPLPINQAESAEAAAAPAAPLRFGFIGLGTPEKGMDVFLAIAARLRARFGDAAEFVHIGRVPEDASLAGLEVLAHPPARAPLARAEFTARLAGLHYAVLPFRRGYYDLSASGALIDALTWTKPIIATRVPLTEQYLRDYGDIGLLCEDEAGLEAAMAQAILAPDPVRHAGQVAALRAARAQREPAVLAARYREVVAAGFPRLLGAEGRGASTPPATDRRLADGGTFRRGTRGIRPGRP